MIPVLVFVLAAPWAGALLLAPFDGRRRHVGLLATLILAATFAASVVLALHVMRAGPVGLVTGPWPAGLGLPLRADLLGIVFTALADGLLLLALGYEVLGRVEERIFPTLVLVLAAGLNGLFLTADAFNFYIFFELSMTASFVLSSYGREQREIRDAFLFTVVNLIGSVLFLSAVAALYHVTGTLEMTGIARWVDTVEPQTVILIAALIFSAFGLKLGLFPFHFWLPAVYRGVRPVVAAMLSGILANVGSYGLLRFGADLLTRELEFADSALILLGAASVIYGAVLAVSRRSPREVLAYSSISQAGYVLIALAIGGGVGLAAAILFAIANALNKTLLFLTAGLSGRWMGLAFAIGALSVAGVPPVVGFFGKAALFRAGLQITGAGLVFWLFVGSALAFVYMFQIYQSHYWTRLAIEPPSPLARRLVVLSLAGLVLGLGLWPEPLLAFSEMTALSLEGASP